MTITNCFKIYLNKRLHIEQCHPTDSHFDGILRPMQQKLPHFSLLVGQRVPADVVQGQQNFLIL